MATRSTITVKCSDGKYRAIYCHNDGYLDGVGQDLINAYNDQESAEELVADGDRSTIDLSYKEWRGEDVPATVADTLEECRSKRGLEQFNYLWDGERWSELENPDWKPVAPIDEVAWQAAKVEFLEWFFVNADFGPADSDVRDCMYNDYKRETGNDVPSEYLS